MLLVGAKKKNISGTSPTTTFVYFEVSAIPAAAVSRIGNLIGTWATGTRVPAAGRKYWKCLPAELPLWAEVRQMAILVANSDTENQLYSMRISKMALLFLHSLQIEDFKSTYSTI